MAERWLVISHEASNSGAPRMLLEVLRGVRAARGPAWSCEILLRRGGPLVREFEQIGAVRVLSHPWAMGTSPQAGLFRKFVDRPWIQPRRFAEALRGWKKGDFDLVYGNTGMNGALWPALRRMGWPIVTHVHELGGVLQRFNAPGALARMMANTDRFVAVSRAVAEDLAKLGAAAERITVVPNFLPALPADEEADGRAKARQRLGLPEDACIVAGCGHVHPIKGTDLFVEMAATLAARMARPVCCLWLGGETDRRFARALRGQVRSRRVESQLRFVGAVDEVAPWFRASDLVAVTSREESFSLVALEAAAIGRPVVGFVGARGLTDLLGATPELLVRDFSAAMMADVVEALLRDPARARRAGARLRLKVGAAFIAGPRIAEILAVTDRAQAERKR